MAEAKPIIIQNPLDGWVVRTAGTSAVSLNASLQGRDGQYAYSSAISLFRTEKPGHIAPGEVLSPIADANSLMNELALNAGVDSMGTTWVVLKNSRLLALDRDTAAAVDARFDVALSGGHASHSPISTTYMPDCLIFTDPTGTQVVLWSWSDAGDGDIAAIRTDYGSQDNDWFSTLSGSGALTSNVAYKLIQAPDGNVHCTNGQYIATATMASGVGYTTATGNSQGLNLGAGYVASGIVPYQVFDAICGHAIPRTSGNVFARSKCRVWLWDGFSPEPNHIFDVQDNFAAGIFYDGNRLILITSGRSNRTRFWEFNGRGFVQFFETTAFLLTRPIQGSMEFYGNSLHLLANSKHLSQIFGNGFHDRTILTDGTDVAEVGMLKNLFQSQLFAGVQSGSDNKVLYQNVFTQYYVNADFRTRLIELPYRTTVTRIIVYFSQFGSGASLRMGMFKDYDSMSMGGDNDLLRAGQHTVTFATHGKLRHYEFQINAADIDSFYLNFLFNHTSTSDIAAIIRKIEIYYKNTGA